MSVEPRSVEIDLQRYLGVWFEIGRLPLKFEDETARDVTAEYSLTEGGGVRVDNRCLDENGEPSRVVGDARVDPEHSGRLRVSFLPGALRWIPFTRADYWVLHVDDEYRHALVGTPDRKHLWLLARDPRVEDAVEADLLHRARVQGYDLSAWIRPEQSGGVVEA